MEGFLNYWDGHTKTNLDPTKSVVSPVLGTSLSNWVGFESEVRKPINAVKVSEEGIVNNLSSIEEIRVFQVQSGTRDFGVGILALVLEPVLEPLCSPDQTHRVRVGHILIRVLKRSITISQLLSRSQDLGSTTYAWAGAVGRSGRVVLFAMCAELSDHVALCDARAAVFDMCIGIEVVCW